MLVDHERRALAAVPSGHDALRPLRGGCRPNERMHGEARGRIEMLRPVDHHEAANLGRLFRNRDRAVARGVDFTFDETRTRGILVAMDQTHDLHFSGIRAVTADHEAEPFAVLDAETVTITGEIR